MNIYRITVYHDKTNRNVRYDGFAFSDKYEARAFGEQKASDNFGLPNVPDTSVHIEFMAKVEGH